MRAVLGGGWLGLIAVAGAADPADPWPPAAAVAVADTADELGTNLSGLVEAGADRLWAVRDDPAELLLLTLTGAGWQQATTGWESGRGLRYPDGTNGPDAEAVATVSGDDGAVYVGAERNSAASASGTSRNSILRYDTSGSGPLIATDEWDLTAVLPATGANTGIEGLTWIDGETVGNAGYSGHADGLFAVGLESGGAVHLVALGDDDGAEVVASLDSGLDHVTELAWSSSRGELWVACDNQCDGRAAVFNAAADGFELAALVAAPHGQATLNNEGLALGPCVNGTGYVVWSDDAATDGHALHQTTLACDRAANNAPATDESTPVSSPPSPNPSPDIEGAQPEPSALADGDNGDSPTGWIAATGAIAAVSTGAGVWWLRRRARRRVRRSGGG